MEKLTLEQFLRYGLPGGLVLLLLATAYTPPPSSPGLSARSFGDVAMYTVVALLLGCIIYCMHRALLWVVVDRMFLLIEPFRIEKVPRRCFVFRPSEEEIAYSVLRWKGLAAKHPGFKNLSEWAAQVHYLLCSAWAIGLAHAAARSLDWKADDTWSRYMWWIFGALIIVGLFHAVRYRAFEVRLLRDFKNWWLWPSDGNSQEGVGELSVGCIFVSITITIIAAFGLTMFIGSMGCPTWLKFLIGTVVSVVCVCFMWIGREKFFRGSSTPDSSSAPPGSPPPSDIPAGGNGI